jgi:RNA polymerase sigma factor (sigma-70 family)
MLFKTSTQDKEQAMIEACKQGSRTAQRQLYEKYASRMYALCLRYVRADIEAEDVLMRGFMKVYTNIQRFEGKGSFEGWIRRIVVNEALEYLRKNKTLFLQTEIEAAHYQIDYGSLDNSLNAEDLQALIRQLPPGYQTVFNLYAIEGYSHKEIAEMLEISEGTSKSQLSRARSLLQQYLAETEIKPNAKPISHEAI